MYFTIITSNFIQLWCFSFILLCSIDIDRILVSAGYCYQCNSRNSLCRMDVNTALKADGTPCNGQCYTRINRADRNILSRGCSWEYGFMKRKQPNSIVVERNSVWIFCDKPFCNYEATTLLNAVCFQPICSFLKFPEDCRIPNADITCGRFCGNVLCGARPYNRFRNRNRNRYRYDLRIRSHNRHRKNGIERTF